MHVKAIVRGLLCSYLVTGCCLMLLAFLLFRFHPGRTLISAGIVITYGISCFLGGLTVGKHVRKNKYLWGILSGIFYFILMIGISIGSGADPLTINHLSTTFCMCLGSGALGGIIS